MCVKKRDYLNNKEYDDDITVPFVIAIMESCLKVHLVQNEGAPATERKRFLTSNHSAPYRVGSRPGRDKTVHVRR